MKFKTKHYELTWELFHPTRSIVSFPAHCHFYKPIFYFFIFKTSETTTTQCCFSILKQKMEMEEPLKEQPLSVGTLSLSFSPNSVNLLFYFFYFCMFLCGVTVIIAIVTWNLVMTIELYGGSVSGNSARSKLQRYPLRSSSKFKESKPDPPDATSSSASKRCFSHVLLLSC